MRASKKAEKVEQPVVPLEEVVHEVIPAMEEFVAPVLAQVRVTPVREPSPSPPPSPVVQAKRLVRPTPVTPQKAINPYEAGICLHLNIQDALTIQKPCKPQSPTIHKQFLLQR